MTPEQLQALVDYIRNVTLAPARARVESDIPMFEEMAREDLAEAFGFERWELE